jgi:intracellular sulfur oxidation DsrE/DsrF family protein
VPGPDTGPQRSVSFEFSADRNQIYTAWNAIANLANQADTVKISVVATNEKGFDQSKLQNGVLEPLREIKLID